MGGYVKVRVSGCCSMAEAESKGVLNSGERRFKGEEGTDDDGGGVRV